MLQITPKKGHLLVAEPSILGDVSFNRSVILLADHNTEGSVGFILNKPMDFFLNDLLPEIEIPLSVYNGGPVEQDKLYYIHKTPELIPNSMKISEGVFWGGDVKSVIQLINDGQIGNKDIRFFLGYSGWDANQLLHELGSQNWIVSENTYKHSIIEKNEATFWKEKMLELGGNYSIWSNAPEDPTFN